MYGKLLTYFRWKMEVYMADLIIEENKTWVGQSIQIDGYSFSRCRFLNCEIRYEGGPLRTDQCEWSNCKLIADGAAGRTVALLRVMDFLHDDNRLFFK